jgi:hypothetical protein
VLDLILPGHFRDHAPQARPVAQALMLSFVFPD